MRIEREVDLPVAPEKVWEVVGNPIALGRLSERLQVQPMDGTTDPEIGSRYRVLLHFGPVPVGGNVEVITYETGRELQWSTVTGVDHRLRLRLRATGDDHTRLTLRFAYDSPGILGTATDLASFRAISGIIDDTVLHIVGTVTGDGVPVDNPGPISRVLHEAGNALVLTRAGIIAPMNPLKLPRLGLAALRWGPTLAAGVAANAIRTPDHAMVVDEDGAVSWREMNEFTDEIAVALIDAGVKAGDAVGLMARNHRGFIEAAVAVAKVGADVLLLNTAFAGPQLTEVCARENPVALIFDPEFADVLSGATEGRIAVATPDLAHFAHEFTGRRPKRPGRAGRVTILTSGTTGTPKGAQRGATGMSLDAPAGILDKMPWRAGMRTVIAAPLFHAWGLANFALGLGLGSTTILRARFDPEAVLADIATNRAQALVVVPVMLQRILELDEETRDRYDVSSLRVVASSGSPISGELARRWMDAFGDNLYNMYGSTEVATATIATPSDMRAAPGTVGKPPRGVRLKLLDSYGAEVPQGETGRIFVGNSMLFEGYTGGGDKDRIGGLAATGDLGRFDEAGRLFVEGRDDEMIVSGGENLFPAEVEGVLVAHPAVVEAAAIGVEDEKFGQRLKAFVVLRKQVSEATLKKHVRDQLANYKVPREIVVLDELPRNATGKVLKRELAEL